MIEDLIDSHLSVALLAARQAGAFVLAAREAGNIEVHTKHTNDFVTDIDKASENLIISIIRETFRDDAIFGEESGKSGAETGGRWIIDPIDGTTNFFRSLPNYTISIAWEIEPFKPLVGVVFNPKQDEMFWASKGNGAFLNGKPIHVSSVSDPSMALLVCVPPHRHHEKAIAYFEIEQALFHQVSDIRSFGSCALELAYIAAGRMDGYYELFLGYYDMAAGMVLVEEAGGRVESADPDTSFSDTHCDLISSNGLIQDWIFHMVHA
ncbi:inositol monophosphatase/fructose-1,6-bisphosphatase family protein [Sphaerochaeta pleomorpha str. Grapes]|uniref:Inositol-1-monophosphatase n=1 Tax=Sphaerochaeta pleomorpha (strain ATCC BAA-1885 / DSM 22778 / Grapes) TaxID=158190 RepID=G8QXP2_SPHPG|nr:inositol monophosphatase family protein [Sphaerochaeta pleomorpha]AEV30686.1 inositol monophosphatase/fructose-1,6-bisphosphatase family protein [Sphaerochaeta pleomorpha str. Grapes]